MLLTPWCSLFVILTDLPSVVAHYHASPLPGAHCCSLTLSSLSFIIIHCCVLSRISSIVAHYHSLLPLIAHCGISPFHCYSLSPPLFLLLIPLNYHLLFFHCCSYFIIVVISQSQPIVPPLLAYGFSLLHHHWLLYRRAQLIAPLNIITHSLSHNIMSLFTTHCR